MIIEQRTYTFHPGKVQEFLTVYEKEGMKIHTKYLPLIGYFVSEIGTLNQVITLWGYDTMADREEKRARLYSDPAWIAFAPKTTHFIQTMQTMILKPTDWSPIK